MKIGIYDPYLDTIAGGEKYMLTAAECLAQGHEVFLLWDKNREEVKRRIVDKFGMTLSKIQFAKNIFSKDISFFERLSASKFYDSMLVLSDGSIPLLQAKLFLHFQTPMEWLSGSNIKTRIKLKRVKKVICNSFYTKRYIDKKLHIKSEVIYPPVLIPEGELMKKENIILNVGRYGIQQAGSSYKKQEILIEAFKRLFDQEKIKWRLVLVVSILETDMERLNNLKITIQGYPIELIINPQSILLWDYYRRAKIYWHAAGYGEDLEKFPDRAEHFGISTVEAMGVGVVPIVINAGGQKEIVTDMHNGVLWNTEEELVIKTKEVIENAELLEELSQNARKRAEDFSPEVFCKKIMATIQ